MARILAVAGLALILVAPAVNGPLLVAVWLVVLVAYRFLASGATTRAGKTAVDGAFLVLLFVAAFEGGWTFLPAALCYLAADVTAMRSHSRRRDVAVG